MRERSRARGWALQVLYAWELRGRTSPLTYVLDEFLADRRVAAASREYLLRLIQAVEDHLDEIDRAVAAAVTNWRPERLSVIDRNVLRLGAAELMWIDDVPARVTLQEAILLAEKYGTENSPRFVNGVLDALMRQVGAATGDVR
jgi:N utilization substance protein B